MRVAEGPVAASSRSTFQVGKRSGLYPRVRVDGAGKGVVSWAGGALLTATIRAAAVGPGGDCLAGIAVVRAEPAVFGLAASDPTVSRTTDPAAGTLQTGTCETAKTTIRKAS
jgi:hypothetical protein